MALLESLGKDIGKTASGCATALLRVPSALTVEALMGKNPIPTVQGVTRAALEDVLSLPFRMTGTVLKGAAKGSLAAVGGIARGTARAVWRHLPIPAIRTK